MANFDNASVKIIQDELHAAYLAALVEGYEAEVDAGIIEGHEANPNILPSFWFNTPLIRLTHKQRAYFVGREIRLWEIAERLKE